MKYMILCLMAFLLYQCGEQKVKSTQQGDALAVRMENESEISTIDPEIKKSGASEGNDIKLNDEMSSKENIDLKKKDDNEPNTYMDPFDPDFISGKWEAEDYNEISFSTWFYIEDGYVSGQYCAINSDASRIDCGTQDEVDMCYIKSPYLVGAKKLEVEIVSCYSMKKGKATIEPYGDGQILWRITQPPGEYGVDYFAHQEAVLYKIHFDPFE